MQRSEAMEHVTMAGRVTEKRGGVPRPGKEQVGDRLSRLRRERGISQTDLGRRVGLDQRMVSCYETGRIRIPAETLLKIADVLHISVYELLGRASSTRPAISRPLREALEKIRGLPPSDQKAVLRYVDLVARDANGRG